MPGVTERTMYAVCIVTDRLTAMLGPVTDCAHTIETLSIPSHCLLKHLY
jgi:hypothetical protein